MRIHPRRDSGFALLLVFLMAAIAAIFLYMEVPRIAFETQRQKEQLLIERGQQYKRAIQLFMRASNNQRWPASMDELESFNRKRFLRHRYIDPMTGTDKWRLVHIQNGVLTDSVNNKLPSKPGDKKDDKASAAAQSIGDYGSSVGSYNATAPGGAALNAALRRRTSDSGVPGTSPFSASGGSGSGSGATTSPDGTTPAAGQPDPGLTGVPPGIPGLPGQGMSPGSGAPTQLLPGQVPGQPNAGNLTSGGGAGQPGVVGPGGLSGGPGTMQAGQIGPGMPGLQPNSPTGAGVPGTPAQSNAATSLINNLLTTPRPGGLQGIGGNTVIGGGIAGVASTADEDSIMVYDKHTNYTEWEFIFDPAKQRYPPPNPVGGVVGTPASQLGSMPGSTPGTPASQLGSMPGTTTGTGTSGTQGNAPAQPTNPDMRAGRQ